MDSETRAYIVIDLEMCKVPKKNRTKEYHYKNEIIQIGAVKLDANFAELDRFTSYVRPRFGEIDEFIENLTGISQKQIEDAPVLEEAISKFNEWINDDNAVMVSWSMSDLKQLRYEMSAKGIIDSAMEGYFDKWVDCQEMFGISINARDRWGLERAIYAANIQAEGQMHDGLMDAVNTASLFRLIKTEPDFKLIDVYESTRTEEVEHLSFSMESLFAGLNMQFA